MAFRQQNKNPEVAWRKDHRDDLLKNGMPDSVVDDERKWNYVLLHGSDEFGSSWDPTWITREQAANLLALLRNHYTNQVGMDLMPLLEKRATAS